HRKNGAVSGPSIVGDATAQFTAGGCVPTQRPDLHVVGPISDDGAASVQPQAAEYNEYAHLVPLQRRYAELAPCDPARRRWRDQLISGYLPVAEHIAHRFAGRGEPLDDLIQVAT